MKKFKLVILSASICAALMFTACNNGGTDTPVQIDNGQQTIATVATKESAANADSNTNGEYVFNYNGATVQMNKDAAPIIEALGSDYQYFESNSCAYQGMDKIYAYTFFSVYTYPSGDKDMISSVELKSDTLQTAEGIRIGSKESDVDEKYGSNFTVNGITRSYEIGDTKLSFVITDGVVTGIVYDYAGLEQ